MKEVIKGCGQRTKASKKKDFTPNTEKNAVNVFVWWVGGLTSFIDLIKR